MAKDALQELAPIGLLAIGVGLFWKPITSLLSSASNTANRLVGGDSTANAFVTGAPGGSQHSPGTPQATVYGNNYIYPRGTSAPAAGSYSTSHPQVGYFNGGTYVNDGVTYVVYNMNDGTYVLIPA
jgi:hypothetical protein